MPSYYPVCSQLTRKLANRLAQKRSTTNSAVSSEISSNENKMSDGGPGRNRFAVAMRARRERASLGMNGEDCQATTQTLARKVWEQSDHIKVWKSSRM